jgi:hypothetical protein
VKEVTAQADVVYNEIGVVLAKRSGADVVGMSFTHADARVKHLLNRLVIRWERVVNGHRNASSFAANCDRKYAPS